jgi:hypothetical protein
MTGKSGRIFVLDANVFIEAHQRYYKSSICPGFWNCLAYYCPEHRLVSIDRVRDELVGRGDELSDWVRGTPGELFVSSLEPPVVAEYRAVMQWIYANEQFYRTAQDEFSRGADGWLAAYSRVHNGILVTHEARHPDARRKVPLPNVCQQFGVDCDINTFDMLAELDVHFNWSAPI